MESGLVDLKTGSIILNGLTLTIGMNFDEIQSTFYKYIKSKSNYKNKEGQKCMIVCFFDYPIYTIPAEVRIYFHDNVSYKIYISYDSNELDINSTNKTQLELYKEKVKHTAKIIKEQVAKQYNIENDEYLTFHLKYEDITFCSYINIYSTECSIRLEKEE